MGHSGDMISHVGGQPLIFIDQADSHPRSLPSEFCHNAVYTTPLHSFSDFISQAKSSLG